MKLTCFVYHINLIVRFLVEGATGAYLYYNIFIEFNGGKKNQ